MKPSYLYISLIILLGILLSQCNYHNVEEYFEDQICDTIEMSFANDINPIIQNRCISCHNNTLNYKDRIYETYEGVRDAAEAGLIVKAINHETGIRAMPDGAPKLPDCEISKIEAWINQGIKNN